MYRLILIVSVAVVAVGGYAFGRYLTPKNSKPDPDSKDIIFLEYDNALLRGLTCEYEVGDLIPCDSSKADFNLVVQVLVDDVRMHYWDVSFCVFDGANDDAETEIELGGWRMGSGSGKRGGFTASQTFDNLTMKSVTVSLNWHCSFDDNSYDLEFPIIFVRNSTGVLNIDDNVKIVWQFNPTQQDPG